MLSREGFEASSSWYIDCPKFGVISLRWVRRDDGMIEATRMQFASTTDRNYTTKTSLLAGAEAYEIIMNVIGRHFEPLVLAHQGKRDKNDRHIIIGELPAECDPRLLTGGKGRKVSGYCIFDHTNPDMMTFATAPDYDDNAARKAHIIHIQKANGKWQETDIPEEHLEIGMARPTSWVSKAFKHKASLVQRYQPSFG